VNAQYDGPVSTYRSRLIDARIERKLRTAGGVLIRGARQVGKTTTALHHAASHVRMDDADELRLAELSPSTILAGPVPRLIDEWQFAPTLWNAVRREIDTRQAKGQFILTGSTAPTQDHTRHSGAGRIARVTLRPMSLAESGDSLAVVSFASLWEGWDGGAMGGPTVADYADFLVRGGWPSLIESSPSEAAEAVADYVDNLADVDLRTLDSPPDPIRVAALIRAVARNTSTQASLVKLAEESQIRDREPHPQTVRKYLDQLTRIYVLDELPAWPVHLRSAVASRVKPTWHFTDPSIATATLRATPAALLRDLDAFGLLFESLAIRDLRAYADTLDAHVFHYRDADGLEVDGIVERPDGAWAGFEIKLGGESAVEEGAAHLLKLGTKLSPQARARQTCLAVVTAGTTSYRRPDGVCVLALGHLTA
jgi:predicted AAA+ superfamily ATPase